MRALIMTLPKSGARMLTSLIDSHPDISCCFNDSIVDVGVFHFHNLQWEWLVDSRITKVLLERDIFTGAVSEMVSPHGERANGQYVLSTQSVNLVRQRRQLHTELLRTYADFVLSYEAITGGREVFEWQSDKLCDLLEISRHTMVCSMRMLRKMIPGNLEELRG